MIKHIVATFGYCEDQRTGAIIFSHDDGFDTPEEALLNLSKELYDLYDNETNGDENFLKSCCKEWLKEKKFPKHCDQCGKRLKRIAFDEDEFADFLRGLLGHTCHDYPNVDYVKGRSLRWSPWGSVSEIV